MNKIDRADYPKNLDWEDKVFSMPNIPRGDGGLISVLREVLTQVANNTSPANVIKFDGSDSNVSLGKLCVRLRPMKLVLKTETGWRLTEYAKKWLDSGDDRYLAAVLCANIKFLGEILYYLDTPKKSTELQKIANDQYGLSWKTLSDVNSRLLWLRAFGFVDFQDFSLLYSITDSGREFLADIDVTEEFSTDFVDDETAGETELNVSGWAVAMCEKHSKATKKPSIGYIPGNLIDFDITIRDYLEVVKGGAIYETILNYSDTNFGIAQSSLRSFLTTLSNIGLVERKTDILYMSTELADMWLEKYEIIDLIFILQSKFEFIFELLNYIKDDGKTFKELSAIAKVTNAFEKENVDEIRKRITILKKAKLVKNQTVDRFIATKRGLNLLKKAHVEEVIISEQNVSIVEKKQDDVSEFLTELRLSAKDSSNFERLERNVANAFKLLGFSSKWIGGAGNTDVLIHATSAPKYSFTVAVDAKSTQTGNVTDGLVDFDTLIEHRKKHNAGYSAIVGGAFQNERLIKRAVEHNVVLIDIDSLENMILKQVEVPLKVSAYKKIFEKPGLVDIDVLDEERNNIIRYGKLLHSVMDCLAEESEDPVTEGLLLDRDIYRSLRSNEEFAYPPTLEEISDMLSFLASPLVGCVDKSKDGYYAVGSVEDAAKKFEFYSKACKAD